ncbi:MAG TPA: alanine racemase [Anaerolineae bacterium]|nr:alanine racemase [Anaerolineae bacterium]
MNTRSLWAEIDISAIKHNIGEARKAVGERVKVMAVVKANAYGHGAPRVAKAACEAGASCLGVALPEEGARLREAGISQPIHVLAESAHAAIPMVFDYDLTATVFSMRSALALSEEAVRRGKIAKVHVKVDTGMNRVGLPPENTSAFIRDLKELPGLEVEGIFTHFSEADNPESDYTGYQLNRFKNLIGELERDGMCPPVKHAANSAAVYLYPDSHFDMVRIGISLYGLHPTEATKGWVNLQPAFSLKARLSFVKDVACGEGVSYGRTYKATHDTIIGTVPAGYGDGYSRLLSNKAQVLIGGRRYPAVGNICMDQFMVDLGPHSTAEVDDEVILIGRQEDEEISADEIASLLGTINYEIMCMISRRVPRVYKE